ncbi:MAG TPA: hypothetical protein DEB46_04485 [Myxococcales bacterium]|nr:hypothetical protein [Myxococcales bacterium]HBU47548.1 hypothetical protein [Myxococcales bacterium]|tara:strand:- start:220 stop:471 length:252 start_codon:yes stop_codon:yes gene_type:complete
MSKKKKSSKGSAKQTANTESKTMKKAPTEAQVLFQAGDYAAARAACGDEDEAIRKQLAVDPIFYKIYAGGLALLGVLAALTMR